MALLETTAIRKRYGGVVALAGATLAVESGEVHALLGENGAGKSTLVKILAGIERADSGELRLDGRPFAPSSPLDALARGIAVVHQHDSLIDAFTVAENLELLLRRCGAFVSRRALERVARECEVAGIALPAPDRRAGELSVGERQRVEIVRALSTRPQLLVLDEPTAALAPVEAEALLESMRAIAASGVGVVFISHYLREVIAVADRVTVLRAGVVARRAARGEIDASALAEAMVGERLDPTARSDAPLGAARLALTGASTDPSLDPIALADLTLEVRGGECVGVVGVAGNGQRALARAVTGMMPLRRGSLAIDGRVQETARPDVAARRRAGLAVVPEDRRTQGLALGLSVAENLVLSTTALDRALAASSVRGFLGPRALAGIAADRIARFGIKAGAGADPVETLSGGNQQRVVLARELFETPAVAMLAQPTRGLDPKASAFVRERIEELRRAGAAVLLVTSDLDEARESCDRILVILRGRIVAEFPRGASASAIGRAMTGVGVAR